MRCRLLALLILSFPSLLCAALPGDSLQDVLREKGNPVNQMEHGNVKILLYRDVEIRLEDDKVVTVTPRPGATPAKTNPAPAPQPKRR